MKNKRLLYLVLLFIVVGIAAVTTNVIGNISTKINPNPEDFNVYFSTAKVNGTTNNDVITAEDTITIASELTAIGDTYTLDYTIANQSSNYDAKVTVTCTESTDYLTISNTLDTATNIEAKKSREGKLLIQLKKSYAGDSEVKQTVTCTLNTEAVERTTLATS